MPKILIVDDEPHIRRLLEETLEDFEDLGVQILKAQNGLEAVKIIISEKPDIVFLDIMMPELNGYDVCKRVKSEKGIQNIKIIMLTAKGQMYDKQKGVDVGVDMYITKPFDPDYIIQITSAILGIAVGE